MTRKKPYPLKIATLQAACGSETQLSKKFTQLLKRALNELQNEGFLKSWRIEKGLVYVERA